MTQSPDSFLSPIAPWHRKLLAVAAVITVLLIAMGGILCVTHSIRSCPDWPGCFGKIIPPLETSPILEYTHRVLAALSGLLILGAAIAGVSKARRLPWIVVPPLVAGALLVEVSYFGAQVVLHGIAPGWAAVDVGSALLVVALMVASAVIANAYPLRPNSVPRISYRSPFNQLSLITLVVVYVVLLSGVLVAGQNSITGCLGWPIYSPLVYSVDSPGIGNTIRLILSGIGILLVAVTMLHAWRQRNEHPVIFTISRWVILSVLLEAVIQVLMFVFGFNVALLIPYTITEAAFWGLLVVMVVKTGLDETVPR